MGPAKPSSKSHSDRKASRPHSETKSKAQDSGSFEALRNTIEAELSETAKTKAKPGSGKKSHKPSQHLQSKRSPNKDLERGKKRDVRGNVIPSASTGNGSRPLEDVSDEEDEFEKEVRALGGTHEDIELVADAQSDSELEGADVVQPSGTVQKSKDGLEKGMSNILKEISLAQGTAENSDDSTTDAVGQSESEQHQLLPSTTQRRSKAGLRCDARPDWFACVESDDTSQTTSASAPRQVVKQLHEYAGILLLEENDLYRQKHQSGSSQSFYNTVIASGTLSDKISALTLAVQDSPIHNKKALETLFALSKKRSRSQAVDVLRALKDLMAQGALLPSSRRLFAFSHQPAMLEACKRLESWNQGDKLPSKITEQHLIVWAFESWLKEQYFEMLQTLEGWCNDELEFAKSRALSYVFELLKEKPEQEANLLRLVVNKLGDPVKKIASQASYLLMQLLTVHPAMKRIVVSAIETEFIFRPGQSLHGKYYATVTLNQTALSANDEDVAQKLLGIYFSLFSAILKGSHTELVEGPTVPESTTRGQRQRRKAPVESGQAQTHELREKLTSALLTGVNRAYPYADAAHRTFEEQLDTLFKISHSANFNTSVQAMLLIQQLSAAHQPSSDRFYRVLYESLLDPRLIAASKQQLYLNLLHRALKADLNTPRVKAFAKRILQILSLHEPSFICGAFFLLKDLEVSFPGLAALTDQAEEFGDETEIFRDVDDKDNLTGRDSLTSEKPEIPEPLSSKYDGHKRAPEHANADHSCSWEVLPFLAHFHPSVVVSADHYTRHATLPGKPDLTLHTLIHFLDRFVYRNAKLSDNKMRGSSIMQPMASENTRSVLLNPGANRRIPVNSEAFKAKRDIDVAAEDVFFHKYFLAVGTEPKKGKKQQQVTPEEEGSDDEDAVWQAMLNTAPELEGAEESVDDSDMSGMDAAMEASSSSGELDDESVNGGVDVEPGFFDDSDDELGEVEGLNEAADFAGLESEMDESVREASDHDEVKEKAKGGAKRSHSGRDQRKKLRGQPVFASAADYAKMLEDDEDEDFGE